MLNEPVVFLIYFIEILQETLELIFLKNFILIYFLQQ